MRPAVLGLPLLLGVLAGCASANSRPPEIRYVHPTDAPAAAGEMRVPQSDGVTWQQLLARLQQSPLKVERADQLAGLIVATYRGDPQPYVDCGWIMAYGPQEVNKTPGSSHEAAFDWAADGHAAVLKRSLELNGRMVIQVRPADPDALVAVKSTYVLTKVVAIEEPSEPARKSSPEFASFTTGKSGKFPTGTVCQPTGQLERLVFDGLPAGVMSAGGAQSPGPAASTPNAPSAAGLDCAGADRAYCQARDIVAPYQQANEQQGLGLALRTVGGAGTTLTEGDVLTFDVSFPSFDSYLHIAYLQRSGVVGNVLPGSAPVWPANVQHHVERTGYEIAPPYGVEMILAIATQQPLFLTPRPQFEPAADYLAALRQRLAELAAAHPGAHIAADQLLIATRPRQPGVSAAN